MRSVGASKTKFIIPDSTSWTEGKELIKATKVKVSSQVSPLPEIMPDYILQTELSSGMNWEISFIDNVVVVI